MKKIFLVEDEPALVKALQERCEKFFDISTAPDGEDGLRMIKKEHPDLIILDILMPRMDGLAMLKKLREDAWGKNCKVMILTNLSSEEKETEAKNLGVLDYLIKANWTVDALIEKIGAVLEK